MKRLQHILSVDSAGNICDPFHSNILWTESWMAHPPPPIFTSHVHTQKTVIKQNNVRDLWFIQCRFTRTYGRRWLKKGIRPLPPERGTVTLCIDHLQWYIGYVKGTKVNHCSQSTMCKSHTRPKHFQARLTQPQPTIETEHSCLLCNLVVMESEWQLGPGDAEAVTF